MRASNRQRIAVCAVALFGVTALLLAVRSFDSLILPDDTNMAVPANVPRSSGSIDVGVRNDAGPLLSLIGSVLSSTGDSYALVSVDDTIIPETSLESVSATAAVVRTPNGLEELRLSSVRPIGNASEESAIPVVVNDSDSPQANEIGMAPRMNIHFGSVPPPDILDTEASQNEVGMDPGMKIHFGSVTPPDTLDTETNQ